MPYLDIFELQFGKILPYLASTLHNFSKCKVLFNKSLQILDQKCLILVFLGCNFEDYWLRWNQHSWIFQNAKFRAKQKKSNLAAKMFYLGIFRLKFEKNYCHIWNQHPEILQNINLCRIPIHALFGCVLFAILKNFCHIWNQYPRFCQKWIVNFALSLKVRLWFRVGFLKYADIRVELFNCCKDSQFHIQ